MSDLSSFNQLFLEELAALDHFEIARSDVSAPPLGSEDPDVRRLVEAMAFFSARTRAAAADATQTAVLRMAGGTLDELLAPMPAAVMVRAIPNDRLTTLVTLDRGTSFRFEFADPTLAFPAAPTPVPSSAAVLGKQVGIFTTLQPLAVRPIKVTFARIRGARHALSLELEIDAEVPQSGPSQLDFYVRRHGDYRASLALHLALQHHCHGVVAVFDGGTEEVSCTVQFGPRTPTSFRDDADSRHPLAQLRSFFHFPEQELYLCVDVPEAKAGGWRKLSLRFAFDAEWPENQSVQDDTFQLHVVPAINAWCDFAAPIAFDGSQAVVSLRNASSARDGVEVCSVRGVYQVDRAMAPLLPLALGLSGDGYEIVRPESGGQPRLRLCIAGAAELPRKILADAIWSQPSLWSAAPGPIQITPQQKSLPGLKFQLASSLRRPQTSLLAEDAARCLDVLSLKMRPVLDREGVLSMLGILGASGDSPYRSCLTHLYGLTVSDAPEPTLRAGGVKHVYHLSLSVPTSADVNLKALLVCFARKVAALLDAWTQDVVEIHTKPSARLL